MRLAFCQTRIVHASVRQNIETIEAMLKTVNADLCVLPELAITGYYFEEKKDLIALSKAYNPVVIERLTALSKKTETGYLIGLAEVTADKLYNTAYLIGPKGIMGKHRKMHLTKNETVFDAGETLALIPFKDINIGVAICFETWFPEYFRRLADLGADVVLCPANFGGPWTLDVCRVRALENSLPVVLANRLGEEMIDGEKAFFCGQSQIIDGYGNRVLTAGEEPCVGVFMIDLSQFSRDKNIICDDVQKERFKHQNN